MYLLSRFQLRLILRYPTLLYRSTNIRNYIFCTRRYWKICWFLWKKQWLNITQSTCIYNITQSTCIYNITQSTCIYNSINIKFFLHHIKITRQVMKRKTIVYNLLFIKYVAKEDTFSVQIFSYLIYVDNIHLNLG